MLAPYAEAKWGRSRGRGGGCSSSVECLGRRMMARGEQVISQNEYAL